MVHKGLNLLRSLPLYYSGAFNWTGLIYPINLLIRVINNFRKVFLSFSTGDPGGDPGGPQGGSQGGLSPPRIESEEEFPGGGGGGTPDIAPDMDSSGRNNRRILLVLI